MLNHNPALCGPLSIKLLPVETSPAGWALHLKHAGCKVISRAESFGRIAWLIERAGALIEVRQDQTRVLTTSWAEPSPDQRDLVTTLLESGLARPAKPTGGGLCRLDVSCFDPRTQEHVEDGPVLALRDLDRLEATKLATHWAKRRYYASVYLEETGECIAEFPPAA